MIMKRVYQACFFGLLMMEGLIGKAQNKEIVAPDWITDTLYKLPEVIREGKYIDSASHHKRRLVVLASPIYDNGVNYWDVSVCEDNGMADVAYFHFYIWQRTKVIKYYDAETGKVMSLAVWRKMKPSWHER